MNVTSLSQHFTTSPRFWTSKEISQWLDLLNMKEYHDVFGNLKFDRTCSYRSPLLELNKVDGLIIFDLEEKEIEEILGVQNSIHRKRFRNGINILRQFQTEFDKLQKKIADADAGNYGLTNNQVPPLSTQQAKIMGHKNDRYLQFNSQTAQKRELDNVFNANALTGFDPHMNNLEDKNDPIEQPQEEQKDVEDSLFNDDDMMLFNRKDKMKNRAYLPEKPFDHNRASPLLRTSTALSPKKLKKSLSLKEEVSPCPKEKALKSPRSCNHASSLNQLEGGSHQKVATAVNFDRQAELIIHPIDVAQSNNFYCINETGGRIGRHSNNEIVILEESVSRYHSTIEYKENKFYLFDIGSTTGTFVKIATPLVLEEGMILEMGSNQFLVEKMIVQDTDNGVLSLKVIEGLHADREFIIENTATIGRKGQFSPTTIALIDDLHLSNTHTKISFSDSKFIVEDLGSTNGTWLRMSPEGQKSQPFELLDGTIFKIGASSTFRAKLNNANPAEVKYVQNAEGDLKCAVCNENERDVVFLPCKHNVSCVKCSTNVKQCPLCKFKVTDVIRIYKS